MTVANPGQNLIDRCRAITLLVTDVDGVLTDGGIVLDDRGGETKAFHVRDGQGFSLWHRAGHRSAIITGRDSPVVGRRARELKIADVAQGIDDKTSTFQLLLDRLGLAPSQAAYIGDDLPDLGPLRLAGLAACPADGVAEVRDACHVVATLGGGRGCVRELLEIILKAQGRWDGLVEAVAGSSPARIES